MEEADAEDDGEADADTGDALGDALGEGEADGEADGEAVRHGYAERSPTAHVCTMSAFSTKLVSGSPTTLYNVSSVLFAR